MNNTSKEIQELRTKGEASMNMTAQLPHALAKSEATLSQKEYQKVGDKTQKP
tara:strand:- start:306 stop:461 length:156 start_codon:yes stop_codon:yes gene_type:complete